MQLAKALLKAAALLNPRWDMLFFFPFFDFITPFVSLIPLTQASQQLYINIFAFFSR